MNRYPAPPVSEDAYTVPPKGKLIDATETNRVRRRPGLPQETIHLRVELRKLPWWRFDAYPWLVLGFVRKREHWEPFADIDFPFHAERSARAAFHVWIPDEEPTVSRPPLPDGSALIIDRRARTARP